MTAVQIALLSAYAFGMTAGQLLFKIVSGRVDFSTTTTALKLVFDPLFILAVALYAGLSIYWVWLLSFTPLSLAYLFVALALVLTPFAAAMLFHEQITMRLIIGGALIVTGILVVAS
jgi:drug/metabolite transporter (DMT)-like permease